MPETIQPTRGIAELNGAKLSITKMQADRLLPIVTRREDYLSFRRDVAIWLPAVNAICQKHDLPVGQSVRLGDGTNVIFAVGDEYIIKLYPPYWQREFQADHTVAEFVYDKLPIATPFIYTYGELEGWPYMVMSRLRGTYLANIWQTMEQENQRGIVAKLGRVLASLHALPLDDFTSLERDWPIFIENRMQICQLYHRSKGVDEHWLEQIPGYLAYASPLYPPDYTPQLLSTDIHEYHLLVEPGQDGWQLCGLFDFDDARIGFREYDFCSAGLFMMRERPDLLRVFLQAYGYTDGQLDKRLTQRLMAYTLLDRYRDLNWILEELVANPAVETLEELAEAIYGLEDRRIT